MPALVDTKDVAARKKDRSGWPPLSLKGSCLHTSTLHSRIRWTTARRRCCTLHTRRWSPAGLGQVGGCALSPCSRLINQIPTPPSARRPIHISLNSQPPNVRHFNLISSQFVPRDVASNPPLVIQDATYLPYLFTTTSTQPPAHPRHQSNHHASRASPSQTRNEQNRCRPWTPPSIHTTNDTVNHAAG